LRNVAAKWLEEQMSAMQHRWQTGIRKWIAVLRARATVLLLKAGLVQDGHRREHELQRNRWGGDYAGTGDYQPDNERRDQRNR
jgi:hypothetical protein